MEDNKKKKPVKTAVQTNEKAGIGSYFKGVRTEIKKVVWPTKRELVSLTGVVIFTCLVFGLATWAVDSALMAGLKLILNISL